MMIRNMTDYIFSEEKSLKPDITIYDKGLSSAGPVTSEDQRAGYWGDYRKCDMPARTIHSMLEHITTTHTVMTYSWSHTLC